MSNKKSQVFQHKDKKPKIELIINAPSNDKKCLEKVENRYIEEYADKYGKLLLNIRCNPLKKTKKIEYKVEMENETQLMERIAKLEKKLTIKDDERNQRYFFDMVINGKRHHTEALTKINKKKQEKIEELTIYFN